ncbi:bifunctional phosphoglucose/phosphomannose isomerase [Miltoncostaea marina]|uniref:bifunctional phosphoglucose/phosphomannose isomerase n=1 Tax=Miltoncostaea marina TaxID=2843215 RepID=UPI001C3D98E3|nr:bifunctional phosphoglucose/phosphomannose isomerase [Miltoncostaea marina]
MFGLDGPAALAGDSMGLIRGLDDSPVAMDEARAAAEAVEIFFPPEAITDVVICGMGGSAIAGDLLVSAYRDRLRRPVTVVRDYYLPGWVGEHTLVVLCSYSGGTEETLTLASQALERESLCVAISGGGKLASHYASEGVPVVPVKGGLQPRMALLRMLVPLAVLFERLGVSPPLAADIDEARGTVAAAVATLGPDIPEPMNPAKQLARALTRSVPLIWGAESTAGVALRWKDQFNENANLPAFVSLLPEMDHNEIVGFAGMPADLSGLVKLIALRDERQHRQVQRRFDFTQELLEPQVGPALSITGEGASPLARMLDLVMLGDYASLYLALLRAVDPGPVEMIDRLKDRLASTGYGRAQG